MDNLQQTATSATSSYGRGCPVVHPVACRGGIVTTGAAFVTKVAALQARRAGGQANGGLSPGGRPRAGQAPPGSTAVGRTTAGHAGHLLKAPDASTGGRAMNALSAPTRVRAGRSAVPGPGRGTPSVAQGSIAGLNRPKGPAKTDAVKRASRLRDGGRWRGTLGTGDFPKSGTRSRCSRPASAGRSQLTGCLHGSTVMEKPCSGGAARRRAPGAVRNPLARRARGHPAAAPWRCWSNRPAHHAGSLCPRRCLRPEEALELVLRAMADRPSLSARRAGRRGNLQTRSRRAPTGSGR